MISRKFGSDIENLVKEKSSNHIILKSRSYSFDNKAKPSAHITRRTSFADSKPPALQLNKTVSNTAVINEKNTDIPSLIQKDEQIVPQYLKDCLGYMKNK